MIMASKTIDGTEAEHIGLVNRAAPAQELDAATDKLVEELLACAPVAVGLQACNRRRRQARSQRPSSRRSRFSSCAPQSADVAKGTRTFAEKRQPKFSERWSGSSR
jgi:enoyl-CoA hydratase/carnithine racemase